jgi:hypothetical protein
VSYENAYQELLAAGWEPAAATELAEIFMTLQAEKEEAQCEPS